MTETSLLKVSELSPGCRYENGVALLLAIKKTSVFPRMSYNPSRGETRMLPAHVCLSCIYSSSAITEVFRCSFKTNKA